ncbi:hypothetical protein ABT354_34710 [Streptomyces sp. NPDC000594]|uniref:hypothetical protein n=1 Tax=Streptomyces sp. NPDC000594 TaxID=3154261 RepID=UPI00331B8C91
MTHRSIAGGGRLAAVTATAAIALVLPPTASAAAAASDGPGTLPIAAATKPDGPIESSLSVLGTGAVAAAGTAVILRRHQRRNRNGRR